MPSSKSSPPLPATTIDEILKAAYFVAAGIDAPIVEVVNPHVINMHFPADGSLATIKIEGRPGAWGGIGPHGTPGSRNRRQRSLRRDESRRCRRSSSRSARSQGSARRPSRP